MKTKNKILTVLSAVVLLLLITWGIFEAVGRNHYYNYRGYVVGLEQDDNGNTVVVTLSGNKESRFTLKWYSRETYKKDTKEIAVGDLVLLSTTRYSNTNIKKISVDIGYSTEGKLVYLNELPNRPFILVTEPTTMVKYLISIVPTNTDLFDDIEMSDSVRIYHTYPIHPQTITIQSDAGALISLGPIEELTEEDISFIEGKGYTVKK